jgi:hypothetical protein
MMQLVSFVNARDTRRRWRLTQRCSGPDGSYGLVDTLN